MIRKIVCFFLLLFTSISLPIQASESNQIYCTQELKKTFETLRELPEVEILVQKILEDGPLRIEYNNSLSKQFDGYWNPYSRTIMITKKAHKTEADRLMTMLFEMHNAQRSNDFKKLDELASKREITQEVYMVESEYIEYENCLSTSQLLDLGREMGVFPRQCFWWVDDQFENHYQFMIETGHAAWYAQAYKTMR